MFQKSTNLKNSFLEQTKSAREGRALEKKKETSIIIIQSAVRRWLARIKFIRKVLNDFDSVVPKSCDENEPPEFKPVFDIYHQACRLLLVWQKDRDRERFETLCNYIVYSLESDSPKISYVGMALSKQHVIQWIPHMNDVLWKCCEYLDELKPEFARDMKSIVLFLRVLVSFTSTTTWAILKNKNMEPLKAGLNQLCLNLMGKLFQKGFYIILKNTLIRGLGRSKVCFKHVSLSAILTLVLRPLIAADFSEKLMIMFLIEILSVPGLIKNLEILSPESITSLVNHKVLLRSLEIMNTEQPMRIVFNALEGNYALCMLANLLNLAFIERNGVLKDVAYPMFASVVLKVMQSCQVYVSGKQSNLTHWHPVLGWFAQPMDFHLQASMDNVISQLHYLWSSQISQVLLGDCLSTLTLTETSQKSTKSDIHHFAGNVFKRVLESSTKNSFQQKTYRNLACPEAQQVITVCSLYYTALNTMTQLRLDILTGLCYQNNLLYNMWQFLSSLGPQCGLKMFIELLTTRKKINIPEFQMLQLFCDCMAHYITILDDFEMYEKQHPFALTDFIELSSFLNVFVYKIISTNLLDIKINQTNPLFQSLHMLLLLLHRRHCRRPYTPDGHWLMKELKVATFLSDLDKGKLTAQLLLLNMPHVILHEDRVRLFRKYIKNEKVELGVTEFSSTPVQSTVITVHRTRIVEDGYRQLALLPAAALKSIIRVHFVNEQGLDEAGIDQDGVFKEFLEESLKRVFDPSLNLFKATSEERLYPSPTSYLQDNHLHLFEFVGRMLGKAVYEGIVVDVPFASFFLSQVSGQTAQASYSCIDELPSLDPDLYKSLSYIKHYEGDVANLELTFSLDEDVLGRLVTYELVPGGKAVTVTNTNKINYIHLMAHFRMHVQIKDQTAAFIRGFRSIINPEWLSMFSTPELQRLISGDNVPLDFKDLRKHTQYYGGFHDSHKLIGWLWDILEKEFNEKEKALFLKFVTSCSKPPLLGFAHLEPPFSIRCIEVGDDEDTGDTVGSVFRGFFTIRKKDPQNRLPTSSTCFNLLKLPNYQRKSTLREKLRYAVTSNTGFELS